MVLEDLNLSKEKKIIKISKQCNSLRSLNFVDSCTAS